MKYVVPVLPKLETVLDRDSIDMTFEVYKNHPVGCFLSMEIPNKKLSTAGYIGM